MRIEDIVLIPRTPGLTIMPSLLDRVKEVVTLFVSDRDVRGLVNMTTRQLQTSRNGGVRYFLGGVSDNTGVCYKHAELLLTRMLYDLALQDDSGRAISNIFSGNLNFLKGHLRTNAYLLSTTRFGGGDSFWNWVDAEEAFVSNGLADLSFREKYLDFYRTGRYKCPCSGDR